MSDISPNPETRIALFQRKEVRRTIHNNEWWFVIVDVVTALTDSADPAQYLKRMRQRDPQLNEAFKGGVQSVPPLTLPFKRETEAMTVLAITMQIYVNGQGLAPSTHAMV